MRPSISGSTPTSASSGSFSSTVKLNSASMVKRSLKSWGGKREGRRSRRSRSKSPPLSQGMRTVPMAAMPVS